MIAHSKREGQGGNRYAVNKKVNGRVKRFVNFHVWKLYEEDESDGRQMDIEEFISVPENADLPFQ